MTDSLLERIRGGYAAWNDGDLERTLDFLAPDVEWHTSASFPGTEPLYRGRDGFRRFWEHLHGPFVSIHVEIESYQREGDVAIMRIRFHGQSRESGVDVDLPWYQALMIEDDRIKRSALDRSIANALEAIGLADRTGEF